MRSPERLQHVVITGATGVLGSRVAKMLSHRKPEWSISFFRADIRDQGAVESFCDSIERPDLLLHFAAVVPTARVSSDPAAAYAVNTVGTSLILQNLLRRNPNLWTLFASTSHVYRPKFESLHETSELAPENVYGRTKLAAEFVATDLTSWTGAGLCIARVFSMYARDQEKSFLFPKLLSLRSARNDIVSTGVPGWNNVRDFLSADGVAEKIVRLVVNSELGTLNIASGHPKTVGTFAVEVIGRDLQFSEATKQLNPTSLVADTSRFDALETGSE